MSYVALGTLLSFWFADINERSIGAGDQALRDRTFSLVLFDDCSLITVRFGVW